MNLYDEEVRRKENRNTEKLNKIIIVSIVFVIILIIGLMCCIYYLINNPNKVTVNLDGKQNTKLEEIIKVETAEDGTTSIYAPIKAIAGYLGYKSFNGGYITVSESTDSCYVENEEEVAIFNLDSDVIYKLDKTVANAEYEYCTINKSIFQQDGVLYTNEDGLSKAFNLYIEYDEKKKIMNIYTLDSLVSTATNRVTKYKYKAMDEMFVNKKAILDDLLVVISEDELYGVVNYSTGKELLGAQYDSITYIPHQSAFLVQKNDKFGIIASDGSTKILPQYDGLTLIDNENQLYLAQSNGLYGVVDINGRILIYIEYDQIGIDISGFDKNELKSGYVFMNKLIPVKQQDKWGFFDIEGNKVTELVYDKIGCDSSTNKNTAYDLLVIDEYDIIVVQVDKLYGFIDLKGNQVLPNIFIDMYLEVSSGEKKYYMVWKNQKNEEIVYNIIDELNKKVYNKSEESNE